MKGKGRKKRGAAAEKAAPKVQGTGKKGGGPKK